MNYKLYSDISEYCKILEDIGSRNIYALNKQEEILYKDSQNKLLTLLKETEQIKKTFKRVEEKEEREMSYSELLRIMNEFESDEVFQEYIPLPFYNQFDILEKPDMNIAFGLSKYYKLKDMVERTIKGERTMLINCFEYIDEIVDEDQIEYNKIILHKRLAFITNYLSLIVYDNQYHTLRKLGYWQDQGLMIHESFVEKFGEYKDIDVSTFFDGKKVHVGRWNVKYLVSEAKRRNTILFLPSESLYPLSLCLNSLKIMNTAIVDYQSIKVMKKMEMLEKSDCVYIEMNDAIPGSGKTTMMLMKYKEFRDSSIVIVPTKNERDELKSKGINVYTIDSLHHQLTNINKKRNLYLKMKQIQVVFVDECFMIHSGQLSWVLTKIREICKYERLYLYGDKGQIPYYAYTRINIQHSRMFQSMIREIKELNVTYRCPQKLVTFLNEVYERKVSSGNCKSGEFVAKELNYDKILQLLSYFLIVQRKNKRRNNNVILVYSQAEKEHLRKVGLQCLTVNEAQGLTFDEVIMVRLNQYERMIYYSEPHLVVALTRTKCKFAYYTVVQDLMFEFVNKIKYGFANFEFTNEMKLGTVEIDISEQWYKDISEKIEQVKEGKLTDTIKVQNVFSEYVYEEKVNLCFDNEEAIVEDIDYETHELLNGMQFVIDSYYENFPHRHLSIDEYLQLVMDKKELLESRGTRFNENKFYDKLNSELKEYDTDTFNAKLQTGQFVFNHLPRARADKMTMLQVLNSIYKRNADPGQIRDFMMTLDPDYVIDHFFETFIDSEKYNQMKDQFVLFVSNYLEEWRMTRTLQQLNKLHFEKENIINIDFTNYNSFIKTLIKNKVDDTQYDVDQAAQVVAGAQAIMVEYFTPMVKKFTNMIKGVLNDNVLINDGVTAEYVELFVNLKIAESGCKRIIPFEMDYSKFDKNQDWLDLYYQLLIMRKFGIDNETLSQWASVHMMTKLTFQAYGISMTVMTQRKSGDAFTFMGNTLFTMLMYSTFYHDVKPICALFGGDDSLVLYDAKERDIVKDHGDEIAAAFNMEIKYMDTTKSVMFASRFFVFTKEHVYVFPDILKQFLRYNRVIKTKEHCVAQQLSSYLLDQCLFRIDYQLYETFLNQMFDRYRLKGDTREMMGHALTLYLKMVKTGRTHYFYHNFKNVRNADKGEFDKIRLRFSKKVNLKKVLEYQEKNKMEKEFKKNYLRTDIVDVSVNDSLIRRYDVVTNMLNINDFSSLYEPIINSIRSYLDKQKISYKDLIISPDLYLIKRRKDKNWDERRNRYIVKENIIIKCVKYIWNTLDSFANWFMSINKTDDEFTDILVSVSKNVFDVIDFDLYYNNLEQILLNINYQLKTRFRLNLKIQN